MEIIKIKQEVKKNGYYILPNFISKNSAMEIRDEYFKIQKNYTLHSQTEKFHYEELSNHPWRKTTVGSSNGLGENISQILQTSYIGESFFKQNSTIFKTIKKTIELRNNLTKMNLNFGSNPNKDGYWNAIRFHHYPPGGGHMSKHHDMHFPKILTNSNIPFVQLSICLTNKGEHFQEGGGFIINKSGNKIYVENSNSMGSLVIFDGSIDHGVDDIDKNKVLDWTNKLGRIALFAGLYEVIDISKL